MATTSQSSPGLRPTADLESAEPDLTPFPEPLRPNSSFRIPPPVVGSQAWSGSLSALGAQHDPLQQLHNRATRITVELHQLVDAQAGALLGGNNEASGGSTSVRIQQATKPQLSLSSVRNGLMMAMRELADVKSREAMIYGDMATERRDLAEFLRISTRKAAKLRDEISAIHVSPEALHVEALREQQSAVASEIEELQRKLRGLQEKHRELGKRISEADNVVQARAASYVGSLESITKKTTSFLTKHHQSHPEAAIEMWTAGAEAFTEKMEAAAREKEALETGMALWTECLLVVRGFESMLREKTAQKTQDDVEVRKSLLLSLQKVVEELESMVSTAERSGWKLLEVCIGSELQAMREASEVLSSTLRQV